MSRIFDDIETRVFVENRMQSLHMSIRDTKHLRSLPECDLSHVVFNHHIVQIVSMLAHTLAAYWLFKCGETSAIASDFELQAVI